MSKSESEDFPTHGKISDYKPLPHKKDSRNWLDVLKSVPVGEWRQVPYNAITLRKAIERLEGKNLIRRGEYRSRQRKVKGRDVTLLFHYSLRETRSSEKAYSVAEIRNNYPRAYEKWTADEDERLKELFQKNHPIGELARTFERKNGAIRSRLKRLHLIE